MPWLISSFGVALLASTLGASLWNIAAKRLPLTLSGQMIVFETLFALLYGFLYEQRWPSLIEWLAIGFLCTGVIWAVRLHMLSSATK